MQLSKTLKITRQKAFMSQEEFANKMGVSVSTINRWETGKSKPNLSAMKKIKEFCNDNKLSFEIIEKEWFANSVEESNLDD